MKGICFKEPLFHATTEGRKTQTRRIIVSKTLFANETTAHEYEDGSFGFFNPDGFLIERVRPPYAVGDNVYLKEPYRIVDVGCGYFELSYLFDIKGEDTRLVHVEAEGIDRKQIDTILASMKKSRSGYANKLFMPEWAARALIRMTAVRPERLQEITDEDCMREGCLCLYSHQECKPEHANYYFDRGGKTYKTPREAYAALIDKIDGLGTWESNPWVWVYDYELIKPNSNDNRTD